jgi:ATP-binding cassette subfamily F protein 3
VRVKDGARVALMTQESLSLDLQRTPLDVVLDERAMGRDDAVRRICALGLDYDHCNAPLGRLSGGQRVRVHLLRVSLQRPDLLLLDEPTNYIDTQSAEVVQTELEAFTGCVVAATHDRYFLETFATRIVELTAIAGGTRVEEREGLEAGE